MLIWQVQFYQNVGEMPLDIRRGESRANLYDHPPRVSNSIGAVAPLAAVDPVRYAALAALTVNLVVSILLRIDPLPYC